MLEGGDAYYELQSAINHGDLAGLRALIHVGNIDDDAPVDIVFATAWMSPRPELLRYLVHECGANVDRIIEFRGNRASALWFCCRYRLYSMARYLIFECGANIFIEDSLNSRTLLDVIDYKPGPSSTFVGQEPFDYRLARYLLGRGVKCDYRWRKWHHHYCNMRFACRRASVVLLGMARKNPLYRDVLTMVAREVWDTRHCKVWKRPAHQLNRDHRVRTLAWIALEGAAALLFGILLHQIQLAVT